MGNLKEIRELLRLQQKDVASQANISCAHYSMIESEIRRPSPQVAQKIALALGFPDKWYKLLEDTDIALEDVNFGSLYAVPKQQKEA